MTKDLAHKGNQSPKSSITVHAAANDALQEIIRHEASSNRVKFFVAGLPRSFADESYTFPNEDEDEFSCTHLPLSGPTYTFLHAEKDQTLCAHLSLRSSPHASTHVHPSMKTTIQSIQTCFLIKGRRHTWDVLPHWKIRSKT